MLDKLQVVYRLVDEICRKLGIPTRPDPQKFPQLALTLTLALSSSMGPPMMVVPLDQARCRFRPPGSARIIREVGRRIVIPRFQDR